MNNKHGHFWTPNMCEHRAIRVLILACIMVSVLALICGAVYAQAPNNRHGHSWDPRYDVVDQAELDRLWDLVPPGDYVTPSMLGANGVGDESDYLAWAMNIAARMDLPLFINREYFFTQTLEIPHGLRIYGRGPDKPGLTMRMDWVMERARRDLTNTGADWFYDTRERQVLGLGPPTITHEDDCYSCTIENLCIDGGYWLVDWNAVATDSVKYNSKKISDVLKQSPACSGLSFSNQNGRRCDGLKVTLHNVLVKDCAGACLIGHDDARFETENLTVGNSVSGRVLYNAPGVHHNLRTYGFSRSSIARIAPPFLCYGFTYAFGDGPKNPWPENDAPTNVFGTRPSNLTERIVIHDMDVDAGSHWPFALKLGVDCEIDGRVIGVVSQHDKDVLKPDMWLELRLTGKPVVWNFNNVDFRHLIMEINP